MSDEKYQRLKYSVQDGVAGAGSVALKNLGQYDNSYGYYGHDRRGYGGYGYDAGYGGYGGYDGRRGGYGGYGGYDAGEASNNLYI